MQQDPSPSSSSEISLVRVHRGNWEKVANIRLKPEQTAFTPPAPICLLEAHYENLEPFAIYGPEKNVIGLVVVAKVGGGLSWVSRILIDENYQGLGLGKGTLDALIRKMRTTPGLYEIRAAINRQNAVAEYLFHSFGFRRLADDEGTEIVMSLPVE